MKLLFKQRIFSWLDSYDIYDENGDTVYTVKGQLSLGHKLFIYNKYDEHIGTIKEEILTFLQRFALYEWDYQIVNHSGNVIGSINKEIFHMSDTYSLTIEHEEDAFYVLMIVLAIDAQKCSRNK